MGPAREIKCQMNANSECELIEVSDQSTDQTFLGRTVGRLDQEVVLIQDVARHCINHHDQTVEKHSCVFFEYSQSNPFHPIENRITNLDQTSSHLNSTNTS